MTRLLLLLASFAVVALAFVLYGRVDDSVQLDAVSTSADRLPSSFGDFIARREDRTPPTWDEPTTTTTKAKPKRMVGSRPTRGDVYPSDAMLHALAMCETGGTMDQRATSPSGRYLSFFQWALSTWHAAGGTGDPRDVSYEVQREIARSWVLRAGWAQWPVCSRVIGAR